MFTLYPPGPVHCHIKNLIFKDSLKAPSITNFKLGKSLHLRISEADHHTSYSKANIFVLLTLKIKSQNSFLIDVILTTTPKHKALQVSRIDSGRTVQI